MNRLEAAVTRIQSHEAVSSIDFMIDDHRLKMIGLELPQGLKEGDRVEIGVKATHLLLCRSLPEGLTISNVLPVVIREIDHGSILASVQMDFRGKVMEAILPDETLRKAAISIGEEAFVLFQASELSILRILGGKA